MTIPRGIPASILHFILCAIAGALLLYILQPVPQRTPELPLVHINPQQMTKLEPTSHPSTLSRIARPVAKLQERVVADGAGRDMLDAFMNAASDLPSHEFGTTHSRADSVNQSGDSVTVRQSSAQRLAYAYAGDITRSRLQLFTLTSDAAKERLTYNACGHVSWRMVGDSAVVQGGRACWLDDAALAGGVGAIAYGAGARNPYVAGVGLAVLGVRKLLHKRPRE